MECVRPSLIPDIPGVSSASVYLLHGPPGASIAGLWSFDPLAAAALAAAAVGYACCLAALRRRGRRLPPRRHAFAFGAGWLALVLATIGPLDALSDDAFSAHMLQHLVFVQLAAPLIALGRPAQLALGAVPSRWTGPVLRWTLGRRRVRRVISRLGHPVTVLAVFNGGMFAWHWPPLYDAAIASESWHALEHATFMATALLFWGIIVDPFPRWLKATPTTIVGLCLTTALVGDVLGAALTLAARVLYGAYVAHDHPLGLDPLSDQRLGGGLMWLSGAIYFVIVFAVLAREARSR